ncbi:MAG: hypothetical protein Tsb0034_14840 [Ekhidna sp.]
MQIKNNSAKTKRYLLLIVKLALVAASITLIVQAVNSRQVDLNGLVWPENTVILMVILFLLMLVNLWLEALRWKVSLQNVEPISLSQATHAVLGGLALNWILPFTAGDALARLWPVEDKYQTSSAMLLNRFIMFSFTLVLGIYGVWSMKSLELAWNIHAWFGVIGIILIGFLFRRRLAPFFTYFRSLSSETFIKVLLLSTLRYTVFVFQFYIILSQFLPGLSESEILGGIAWIFLVRSVLPILFGGLGVREVSGMMYFSGLVQDLTYVIVPVFIIWLLNTALPSALGCISVWKMKPKNASSG